jgi:hypothetical protein
MLQNNLDQTKQSSNEVCPVMSFTMLTLYEMRIWNVKKGSVYFSQEARLRWLVYVNVLAADPAVFIAGILLLVAEMFQISGQ